MSFMNTQFTEAEANPDNWTQTIDKPELRIFYSNKGTVRDPNLLTIWAEGNFAKPMKIDRIIKAVSKNDFLLISIF